MNDFDSKVISIGIITLGVFTLVSLISLKQYQQNLSSKRQQYQHRIERLQAMNPLSQTLNYLLLPLQIVSENMSKVTTYRFKHNKIHILLHGTQQAITRLVSSFHQLLPKYNMKLASYLSDHKDRWQLLIEHI